MTRPSPLLRLGVILAGLQAAPPVLAEQAPPLSGRPSLGFGLSGEAAMLGDRLWPQLSPGLRYRYAAEQATLRFGAREAVAPPLQFGASAELPEAGLRLEMRLRLDPPEALGLPLPGLRPPLAGMAMLSLGPEATLGAGLRTRPDATRPMRQTTTRDLFGAWMLNPRLAFVLAWSDLGRSPTEVRQSEVFLSLRAGF